MVESKRKRGESFEVFLRKFNKRLLLSGKLNEVRKRQHHTKKLNKTAQKARALTGKKIKSDIEYLKKIGKFDETQGRKR